MHDIVTKVLPRLPHKLSYSSFQEPINCILEKHLPIKKKYVRENDGAFMTKELRKATIHRSKLRNRYNKTKLSKISMNIKNRETFA